MFPSMCVVEERGTPCIHLCAYMIFFPLNPLGGGGGGG